MSSCATQDFTRFSPKLVSDYNLSDKDLSKIQFYVSGEIVLRKEKSGLNDSLKIKNGEVITKKEDVLEKITIPINTPCTFESRFTEDILTISFENGNDRTLFFAKNTIADCFSISAIEWDDENTGKILYAGKLYLTNNGNVFLNIKAKSIRKITRRTKVVSGRKI